MRSLFVAAALFTMLLLGSGPANAQQTEQDIIDKYMKKAEKLHVTKLGWASISFAGNRVNRHNDFNDFALVQSDYFSNGSINWIEQMYSIGIDMGLVLKKKFAWSIGGEYWLKHSQEITGTQVYSPPASASVVLESPSTDIKVIGFSTGLQYYLLNAPTPTKGLTALSIRAGGSVGFYQASWNLWQQYANLNLSTSTSDPINTTFKGTSPGFGLSMGADYPLNVMGLSLGADMEYFYLNFKNVAWYNGADQEIVASIDGTPEGRVDLNFSGFRGKVQLKRFFRF